MNFEKQYALKMINEKKIRYLQRVDEFILYYITKVYRISIISQEFMSTLIPQGDKTKRQL